MSTFNVLTSLDGFEPLLNNIHTSKKRIEDMEAEIQTERQQLRTLYKSFESIGSELRSIAGITDGAPTKRRGVRSSKPKVTSRDPVASIAGGASRVIRQAKEDGKDRKEASRLAIESALKCAKKKHNMTELTKDIKVRIEKAMDKYYQ
jgi:hypothetical protein